MHTNDYDYVAPPEDLDENAEARRVQFTSQTFETEHPVVRKHRVTVAGDVPFGIDGTRSRSITGDASHYVPAH